MSGGADVDHGAVGGQTPLFVASGAGRLDCTRALLNAGADRSRSTTVSPQLAPDVLNRASLSSPVLHFSYFQMVLH